MLPPSASPAEKRCNQCGQTLPLAAFYPHPTGRDGYMSRCKPCERAYQRERRAALKARAEVSRDPTATKVCPRCGETKPLTDFPLDRGKRSGASVYCKACSAAKAREYRVANPERVKASKQKSGKKAYPKRRVKVLQRNFALTREQYDAMLAAQAGGCAICGAPPNGKELAVDHDHTTGAVRGLLCQACNLALGQFRDSPALLRAAMQYLAKHGTTE